MVADDKGSPFAFESHADYQKWCEGCVTSIYYANIAMNNERIKEVVSDIADRLHLVEGQRMYPDGQS